MVATALFCHSHALLSVGDYTGAEELVRRSAAIRRAHHGENSMGYVDTLLTLAFLVLRQERLEESKELLDRVRTILTSQASGFSANAWEDLVRMEAQWYFQSGDYDQAENSYLEALEKHKAKYTGPAPSTPDYLYRLGRCAVRRGNEHLAKERFDKALQLLQEDPSSSLMAAIQTELDALE